LASLNGGLRQNLNPKTSQEFWMLARLGQVLCCVLSLAGGVIPTGAQTNDTSIIVTLKGNPVRLLGFVATGPQPDLDRLLAAAKTTPFFAKELSPPDGPGVMVVFKQGSNRQAAINFFSRSRSDEFSALKISAMISAVN
jgi:hypothetical protein